MLTPLLSVNILVATFIAANSWKSNFAAYGITICAILVLFLHGLHSNWPWLSFAMGVMRPQISQMWTRKASLTSSSLSFKNAEAP